MANNIKVAIKVRPLISREKKSHVEEQWTVTQNSIVSLNPLPTTTYHFGILCTPNDKKIRFLKFSILQIMFSEKSRVTVTFSRKLPIPLFARV